MGSLRNFESVEDVRESLEKAGYICSKLIATVVFLAQATHKPVLIEGPTGVGKTELAKADARCLNPELVRLQCYEGLDAAKALYEWEYAKQLLYTQMVKEKINDVVAGALDRRCRGPHCRAGGHVFLGTVHPAAAPASGHQL